MKDLFEKLNEKGIKYCVMRTWKDLESNKDVDIVLMREDLEEFKEIGREKGWSYSKGENHTDSLKKQGEIPIDIHLDGLDYNNIIILKGEGIIENREKEDFVYVPSDSYYITGLILHSIIDKGYFKHRYREEILDKWENNRKEVFTIISEEYGNTTATHVVEKIDKKDFQSLLEMKYRLIHRKSTLSDKLVLGFYWFKHQFAKLPLVAASKYSTTIISFIGVDGSGKTTAVKMTEEEVRDRGSSYETVNLGVYHERSFLLKILGWLYRKYKSSGRDEKSLSESTLNSNYTRKTPLRNILLLLDMKWRILKKRFKRPTYLLTDRHYSDLFIQSDPDKITRKAVKLLDDSDKLIFLYNDPEVLYERSGERTPEILQEQMNQLEENLEKTGIDFHKIKTDSLSETEKDIEKLLFN